MVKEFLYQICFCCFLQRPVEAINVEINTLHIPLVSKHGIYQKVGLTTK